MAKILATFFRKGNKLIMLTPDRIGIMADIYVGVILVRSRYIDKSFVETLLKRHYLKTEVAM